MKEYSRELARFCAGISIDDIPPEVIDKTKLCILDCIANIYGSWELEAVRNVAEYIRSQGEEGPATIIGEEVQTSVRSAAFINGTAAEAIEAQDGLRFGGNHPGTAVIPAAFALAEQKGRNGVALIEAVIAGYEAANRPAAAMHPYHTLSGFLPTGTCGAFGAAAAAAKLSGFDEEKTLNALGNAGYLLPLSMAEQLMGGYTVKIVQGGQAAVAGITAAGLAAAGITGHPRVFEGSELKGGFTQITSRGEPVFDRLTEKLGEHYTIMDIYFKPYTACRHTHGAIQAALKLRNQGIAAGDIEAVNVFTYGIALIAVGKGVKAGDSFVSAQFSIPYTVAAALISGEMGPLQLRRESMEDPTILDLADRVTVAMDEELNGRYPGITASRLEIVLKNGTKLVEQTDIPAGDPRDPMGWDEISEKVRRFAGRRDAGRVEKAIDMIRDLEHVGFVPELMDIL